MNSEEIKNLKHMILQTAAYYARTITADVLSLMASDLSDLSFDAVAEAFRTYRFDANNKFFPLPAQIRQIVHNPVDERTTAIDLATRIDRAIKRHGKGWGTGYVRAGEHGQIERFFESHKTYFSTWEEAALDELGSLGFEVIRRNGWSALCDQRSSTDSGTFHAQLREKIIAVIKLSQANRLDTLPTLSVGSEKALKQIQDAIKPVKGF